jgi:Asp-tRNA(Asn)/Glu-tRNA(Gln) amidotransferase A subunit family amidase
MELHELTATQAVQAMRAGQLTSEQLVAACLARIRELEERVQAWAFLDPDHALAQARRADEIRREGKVFGPLHGVPVGIKDIFDTADMPTELGTVLHQGGRPKRDATAVALLRQAGAVILGKTVTTELAYFAPGKTTNPRDPKRTPGGSSSGSAAAVAAGMVPLAIGSQTNGSVLRPASFCGVFGFKPSYGLISRHGMLSLSRPLDQVGVFARSIEDVALIGDCLMNYDAQDADMQSRVRPSLVRTAAEEPPASPLFVLVKTPMWSKTQPDTQAGFAELSEHLGGQLHEVELSVSIEEGIACHRLIMEADMARSLAPEYERGRDQLSAAMRAVIERGRRVTPAEYERARAAMAPLAAVLDELFLNYGTIVTPVVAGEAPLGLESTGDPIFCTFWTLCRTPSISVPLLQGANGLPIGVQLVGAPDDDGRLLRSARWLVESVEAVARGAQVATRARGRKR